MVGLLKSIAGAQNSLANAGKGGAVAGSKIIGSGQDVDAGSNIRTMNITIDPTFDLRAGDIILAGMVQPYRRFYDAGITTLGFAPIHRDNFSGVDYKISDGSEETLSGTVEDKGVIWYCIIRLNFTPVTLNAVVNLSFRDTALPITVPSPNGVQKEIIVTFNYLWQSDVGYLPATPVDPSNNSRILMGEEFQFRFSPYNNYSITPPIAGPIELRTQRQTTETWGAMRVGIS